MAIEYKEYKGKFPESKKGRSETPETIAIKNLLFDSLESRKPQMISAADETPERRKALMDRIRNIASKEKISASLRLVGTDIVVLANNGKGGPVSRPAEEEVEEVEAPPVKATARATRRSKATAAK